MKGAIYDISPYKIHWWCYGKHKGPGKLIVTLKDKSYPIKYVSCDSQNNVTVVVAENGSVWIFHKGPTCRKDTSSRESKKGPRGAIYNVTKARNLYMECDDPKNEKGSGNLFATMGTDNYKISYLSWKRVNNVTVVVAKSGSVYMFQKDNPTDFVTASGSKYLIYK